jgi:precorrin-2/cobalt-factor-2 C20-methyltransferase
MDELRNGIAGNDVVVLMKIGKRLPQVVALLQELRISAHCAFGRRIGLPDEVIVPDVSRLDIEQSAGYLSTMLIRSKSRSKRKVDEQ